MSNKSLTDAKKNKADEFYTQLGDIEAELRHYSAHFSGKVIYCNCDDPFESNFFKYFAMNFNHLKLKSLIATSYVGSPIMGSQLLLEDNPYQIRITEVPDVNSDGCIDLVDVELLLKSKNNSLNILAGNGDFRSEECIELLKEADIVVTNPPFSLFREYFAQLINYDKKFVIIGSINAVNYKDVFKLLKEDKAWIGHNHPKDFTVPIYKGDKISSG